MTRACAWFALARTLIVGWPLVCSVACYQSGGDDDAAPAASAIPEAAEGAVGADYPAPNASGSTRSTGIASCDEYLHKIATCKSIPPEAQKALREHGDQMREQILKATTPEERRALEEACKSASEGLSMCDTNL